MTRRSMFLASFFIAGVLAAFLFLAHWRPEAAIFGACAALVGALCAWLLLPQTSYQAEEKAAAAPLSIHTTDSPLAKAYAPFNAAALLDAMLDSMREGVLMVDDSLTVVSSNRAARDVFTGLNGHASLRRLSEVTRNLAVYEAFTAALHDGLRSEVKVETGAGVERRTYDLRVAPLSSRGARSDRRMALGIFFDITRLERLERVRQEFLSNVSHELRTPLTAILAFIETLEEGAIEDPADGRRMLTIIRRNAARMHTLIDDILELSAIEAGTVKVQPERVNLYELVEDVKTAVAAQADAAGVSLHNEVAPGVFVLAEARRLEQMLTNLLDNAIKFNRAGGEVSVTHEAGTESDRIKVRDTGEGIPGEHLPRIFERFYRVDRARSRALGGTGLGLAIVKHLARAHGGEAQVQSEPGTGTTFTIELPKSSDR